jgi:hypothetical protein
VSDPVIWPPFARPFRSSPPEGSVGVVLPVRDDLRFFKLCFYSLISFTDYRFMLTIVDNMSSLDTRQYLSSIRKNHAINILSFQKDHNLSAEWNLGLRYMFAFDSVRFGVCLTPTFVVDPYWLSSIVRAARERQCFVAPKSNAGVSHAIGFQRSVFEKIAGFDESIDPVVDAAQRGGIATVKDAYVHKFTMNNFDPRRADQTERRETQEANHATA